MVKAEALKRLAATFFADGSLSLGKAAELAKISKQDFLDFLAEHEYGISAAATWDILLICCG
ncbi:UPF0175 family protein [Neomoorella mulderi]|uniref:UPF0175 family protein n=1 Tax=Neomoorella mulderi TaxID=202604 RepID=UPI001F21D2E7|nr:UPF0175 family protein [Moorella mulderi]